MVREFQIKVENGKSMEATADWLAMSASTILEELFPEQWREAMALVAQRISQTIRQEGPPDVSTR